MKFIPMNCPNCGGAGRYSCTTCGGHGGYYKLSPTDGHSYWVNCGNCSSGSITCSRCHGVGKVDGPVSYEYNDRDLMTMNYDSDHQGISMTPIKIACGGSTLR